MKVVPITNIDERVNRILQKPRKMGYPLETVYAHLNGLETFAGKRVLEIGGAEDCNLAKYFLNMSADYHTVRLDPNEEQAPYVTVGNFMDLQGNDLYDLIISVGVFEEEAVDRRCGDMLAILKKSIVKVEHEWTNLERLRKLYELTKDSGINIIGTQLTKCIFTTDQIRETGFSLQYRDGPFHSFSPRNDETYWLIDSSELLILNKKVQVHPEQKTPAIEKVA